MINEILIAENLLAGVDINRKGLYGHCYLLAKYYLQQGYDSIETREKILIWANNNHIWLANDKINLNQVIYKAGFDKKLLRGKTSVNISKSDISEIKFRFDTVPARQAALAMLCYAKACADSTGSFKISITGLSYWLGFGRSKMYKVLAELISFQYIERLEVTETKSFQYAWSDNRNVKSQSKSYKILVQLNNNGKYCLHDNDINGLYKNCFEN